MGTKSVSISSKNILTSYLNQIKKANHAVLGSIYLKREIKLPQKGGIYIFWWDGKSDLLIKNIINHKHLLKGSRSEKEPVDIRFNQEWIKMATIANKICLYVGKSTNLHQRIGKHLKPDTKNIWGAVDFNSGKKPNTESQLRIGIERILKCKDARQEIFQSISVTYIELDGTINCVNRFYLEDLIVGTYFPLLNIDIER